MTAVALRLRKHGPLLTTKACARPQCGRVFRPWRKDQACCSRSCARKNSPVFLAHLRSVAKRGGEVGGRMRRERAAIKWREEVKGLTPGQIAAKFYRRGYSNGSAKRARAAYNTGFDDGYQQARRDRVMGCVLE